MRRRPNRRRSASEALAPDPRECPTLIAHLAPPSPFLRCAPTQPTQRCASAATSLPENQAHALYRGHLAQADLFIIFGCSLGESDGWWWRNIVQCLRQPKHQSRPEPQADGQTEIVTEEAELIIYWWQGSGEHTAESVKDRFLKAAGLLDSDRDRQALADRIRVVLYDDATPRTFLNSQRSSASA